MKKQILVIVAHPDDETIWMGGTLLRNKKNWNTTIISLCRSSDKDRAPKFKKVCKILGVRGFIFNLYDESSIKIPLSKHKNLILKVAEKNYDIIFTHNNNGEYGHIRHKETHKAVKQLLKQKKLNSKKTFFFSYLKRKNNFQGYAICNSSANKLIKLNDKELSMKKYIIKEVYGFQEGGFEEKSSGKVEAFDELSEPFGGKEKAQLDAGLKTRRRFLK